MGILEEACKHMSKSQNVSSFEQELGDVLRIVYPKTQTLRIRKKDMIPDKPHIQGLDIDHYILEVRKGVEFDGTHWHDPEVMKKSRPHWPDEDILNYHQIKDGYFLEQHNIPIFHVKEEDWLADKEACIKQVLKFLET
jgi:hypothetical protein